MDELTLVRSMRSETRIPEESFERGRASLAGVMAAEAAPEMRRPRHRRRWGFGVAAAATLAIGAVVASGIGWGGHPQAASAAPLLRQAAAAVQHDSDPIVGPGQYLEIIGDWYAAGTVADSGGRVITAMSTYTRTLYVPADRSGVWVYQGSADTPVKYLGDAKANWKPEYNGKAWTETGPGGRFSGGSMLDLELADVPANSTAALAYLRKKFPGEAGGLSTDEMVWQEVTGALVTGLVPAAVRSTLYGALAELPGVTVADKSATIAGRTGTAITLADPNADQDDQLVIDPATGLLIGEQWIQVKAAPTFPAGSVAESVAITTRVTDRAPAQ
ncbi:CU044_5270 family protein [Gryllotalpicola reticulitermitis]|uniref:CU044_5270 family protein n=1 Tax=Gryllotalpicola reticulitermitis TaxID=1184153 RepID=A0ABV8Q5S0_9MICO